MIGTLLGGVTGVLSGSARLLPRMLNWSASLIGVLLFGLGIVLFVISPVAVFSVGYWIGRTVDVPSEYTAIALISGVVGSVASIGGVLVVVVFNLQIYPLETVTGVGGLFLTQAYHAVELGIEFAIASVAGAAVAHFRHPPS